MSTSKDSGAALGTLDWQQTMQAIEAFHLCKLDIVLTVERRPNPTLVCVMTARRTTSLAEGQGAEVGRNPLTHVKELWPVPHAPERFSSFLYRALLEMDGELSRAFWQQERLAL